MIRLTRLRSVAQRHGAWVLWLALLLLPLAQVGANAHALAHLGAAPIDAAAAGKHAPHLAPCEFCLIAASVAGAAPQPNPPGTAPIAARHARPLAAVPGRRAGPLALAYRSRAPPLLSPR